MFLLSTLSLSEVALPVKLFLYIGKFPSVIYYCCSFPFFSINKFRKVFPLRCLAKGAILKHLLTNLGKIKNNFKNKINVISFLTQNIKPQTSKHN